MSVPRMYEQVLLGNFLPPKDLALGQRQFDLSRKKDRELWEVTKRIGYSEWLKDIPPFFIDDIAQEWVDTTVDLVESSIAAPYPKWWMEYRIPKTNKSVGVACFWYKWEQAIKDPFCFVCTNTHRRKMFEKEEPYVIVMIRFEQDFDAEVKGITVFDTQKEVYIDNKDGRILQASFVGDKQVSRRIDDYTLVSLFALAVLNSNSSIITETKATSGIAAKIEKKTGNPIIYKTLTIRAMGPQVRYIDSRELPQEEDRRQHSVRGHFKTYTQERPLFGKWVGRYYVRSHDRGNPDVGQVIKRYNITP